MSRRVVIKRLKGDKERVCIHWYRRDPGGSVQLGAGSDKDTIAIQGGPASGTIACAPQVKSLVPQNRGGVIYPVCHSDDPRAVTCPECRATPEYAAAMEELTELLQYGDGVVAAVRE